MTTNFSLDGKIAIVTGASRGLGQGMAIGLAEAGADIIGVGVSNMEGTKTEVEKLGRKFYGISLDLSQPDAAYRLVEEVFRLVDRVNILVNNAGIIRREQAENFSDKDWEEVIRLNLDSVFKITREIGKCMIKQGKGKIINIASMLSFQGGIKVPAYTASKHAVAGLTKAFANEWASKGINVNAIAPGYMVTDNTAAIRADKERNAAISARIPAGRWGTPEDLKGPVVFLASDASNYVNGHILCVDGGWMSY
ncbi:MULTISPECIES: 2-dehydro-3-deoxy-D-gluconate 5-dehydrogenase KduD [Anoxybacillaceae]|uniref:2-dehydro-3-deoxy-D-gluconate 5-dehydrogenase KduD n=1 Tax=Anoxybacillaceae TaxID=3120669 RepID=UPI0009BF6652|nr:MULTISPECIES: 2-dehydro-3-deoxy-D-gluconate 5-dehydrogenase KduD [Bacillaceae]OQP13393.1 2-deoxy-D-gluconate 3-dehydrogenase [Geobacillus zalihae]BDG36115.1 2-deoxy-D-gluconate 3-dehydrogenase [Parageobacillus caldoxylosilyticus]BDG39900.1 2-deoxy-D-gluconate 3-dehydrogenase [Parageobacillus caldoxylosilyticus]